MRQGCQIAGQLHLGPGRSVLLARCPPGASVGLGKRIGAFWARLCAYAGKRATGLHVPMQVQMKTCGSLPAVPLKPRQG